jgi:hypothetical protein
MLETIDWEDAVEIVRVDVNHVMQERVPAGDLEGDGFTLGAPFTDGPPPDDTINGGHPIDVRPLHDEAQEIHVVPWSWTGVDNVEPDEDDEQDEHDVMRGLFNLGATHERVTVHGVTFVTRVQAVDDDSRGYQLYRYIDWLDVFAQAGISISTRPVVDTRTVFDEQSLREIPELRDAYDIVEHREPPEPREQDRGRTQGR